MVEQPLKQGAIYLAKLNPSKTGEIGKVRPVVILTQAIFLPFVPAVFVCPLSSKSEKALSGLHLKIPAREHLLKESFTLIEHCRSISRERIIPAPLAHLTQEEVEKIKFHLNLMIGY